MPSYCLSLGMTPIKEERALVRRTKAGDQSSFESLELSNREKVTLYAKGLARGALDHEEIYQRALIKAWKNIKKFRGDCRFSTWLCKICHSLACDEFRKGLRNKVLSYDFLIDNKLITEKQSNSNPLKDLQNKETEALIDRAFNKLNSSHKQILNMRLRQGLSYRDMASQLGVPEGTVMSRVFHAKRRAQKLLK